MFEWLTLLFWQGWTLLQQTLLFADLRASIIKQWTFVCIECQCQFYNVTFLATIFFWGTSVWYILCLGSVKAGEKTVPVVRLERKHCCSTTNTRKSASQSEKYNRKNKEKHNWLGQQTAKQNDMRDGRTGFACICHCICVWLLFFVRILSSSGQEQA